MQLSWTRLFGQFRQDVKLWTFCVLCLALYRLVFILYFRGAMGEDSGIADVGIALFGGLRYDSMVASYWIALPLLVSVACSMADWRPLADRFRRSMGAIFLVATTLLSVIAMGFFREFNDIFNEMIFGVYYDDAGAIMDTIAADVPLLRLGLLAAAVVAAGYFALKWLLRHTFVSDAMIGRHISTPLRKTVVTTVAAAFLLIAVRGSVGDRPAQRLNAAVTGDPFLNKATVNPYYALKIAIKDHRLLQSAYGIDRYLGDSDIRAAARIVNPEMPTLNSIDDCLIRFAQGPKTRTPRHIFLIIEESYDSWPMLEEYASLRLTENLRALADSGIFISRGLPASWHTMGSIAALLSGLSDPGVHTSYQPSAQKTFPSSPAAIFRRLGFRTRLFYAGYLSWEKIGDFARAQGFEELYGAAHIGLGKSTNTWGVDDRDLFDFVSRATHDTVPSFNLILTTTYHKPFDIDVWAEGYSVRSVPTDLESRWDGSVELEWLGHLWYADRELGAFVRRTESRLPESVFAISGDHASHLFVNARRGFYEASSVPIVFYGPEILDSLSIPAQTAGSHLDIVPTLIELAAPEGFAYHAAGRDLLGPDHDLGFCRDKIIGPDFIAETGSNPQFHPLPFGPLPDSLPDIADLKRRHDALQAVSWWRVMRGAAFPDSTSATTAP